MSELNEHYFEALANDNGWLEEELDVCEELDIWDDGDDDNE